MDENPYKAPQTEGGGRPQRRTRWAWYVSLAMILAGLALIAWVVVRAWATFPGR